MIPHINQDPESHLHAPGGPLHAGLVTRCDGCRAPIPEGGYFVLDEDVYCQRCAVLSATETLIDGDQSRKLDIVETQALDILRQFVRETEMRGI